MRVASTHAAASGQCSTGIASKRARPSSAANDDAGGGGGGGGGNPFPPSRGGGGGGGGNRGAGIRNGPPPPPNSDRLCTNRHALTAPAGADGDARSHSAHDRGPTTGNGGAFLRLVGVELKGVS